MTKNGSNPNYVYDAESRLIAANGISYIYDGDGERVEKCTEGTTAGTCASGATGTLYWRGTGSGPQAETDLSGNSQENYFYFNGQRIARRDASNQAVHFYFSDHLGTHSLITDQLGTMPPQYESDYYPYGGEIPITTGDLNHFKFTGKERDAESGLDNFGKRYDSSSLGRFMTPDKPFADQHTANPQSWNLYEYGRNNPLRNVDPNGFKVLEAVVAKAVAKMNAMGGHGTFYLDFAGIQGLHKHQSITASSFDNWHSDHSAGNAEVVPNKGILSGLFRAFFGLANKDQADTGKAIVAAAPGGINIAFDTYSNGVNAAGQVAQGMSPGDLESATVVGPNANSPAPVQAMDQADLDTTLIFISSGDPALALALFGSQSVDAWASEFPGRVFDTGQSSHNLDRYNQSASGSSEIQQDMQRLCNLGNPAACK